MSAECKAPLTGISRSGTLLRMHAPTLSLEQLRIGERAKVVGYVRGDRGLRDRLLSLGLTRGTDVELVRTGPTGCPIELRARGTSLVLRRTEAAALHVERVGGGS